MSNEKNDMPPPSYEQVGSGYPQQQGGYPQQPGYQPVPPQGYGQPGYQQPPPPGGYGPPPPGAYPQGQPGAYPPGPPGAYPPGQPGAFPPGPPGQAPYGQPMPQPGQPHYATQTVVVTQPGQPGFVVAQSRPPDYMIPAILACFCCFCPTGSMAIYYASKANSLAATGDMVEANRMANNARNMMIVSVVVGVCWILLVTVLRLVLQNSYAY